eukprot:scaffold87073_cov51-Attheya_sp.AAC.3
MDFTQHMTSATSRVDNTFWNNLRDLVTSTRTQHNDVELRVLRPAGGGFPEFFRKAETRLTLLNYCPALRYVPPSLERPIVPVQRYVPGGLP